ncbi:hypothetical protein, partial [Bosea sp. (in: a-proteobacteria)]|uniref:hypothetical protein n=1 Tax=Bosea sp. (in: a-proteobacteria) TaxID=1871050 RepID=UPI0031FE8800
MASSRSSMRSVGRKVVPSSTRAPSPSLASVKSTSSPARPLSRKRAKSFAQDRRIHSYWSPKRAAGMAYAAVMPELEGKVAWDLYMIFPRGM